ncbi:zinc ribbon domain-containing protein [Georgenia sp. 10Sc9-8]|uniref:Zinc ribbon domain-containing protein n=1 Tax=Georgenia halotolerans TaxID=3028317 RepID=A0ABT5TVS4_9MICO|nr:zinc ribbon domain-containing protein [Georgenia halotolerans]
MATYEFRCPVCGRFDGAFPMADVPAATTCPGCGADARRLISSPRLSRGSTPAMRAIDAAARSASEPDVVRRTHPGSAPRTPTTRNPLHARLPRP